VSDFATLLQHEIQAVERFVDLLRSEQSALQAGDAEALTGLTAAKNSLIDELGRLAAERNRQLSQLCGAEDRDGLARWAEANGPAAAELRQRLLNLAAEARELNTLNGKLLTLRLNHTQSALFALHPGTLDHVYGRDGQPSTRTGYRIIDTA